MSSKHHIPKTSSDTYRKVFVLSLISLFFCMQCRIVIQTRCFIRSSIACHALLKITIQIAKHFQDFLLVKSVYFCLRRGDIAKSAISFLSRMVKISMHQKVISFSPSSGNAGKNFFMGRENGFKAWPSF